MESSFQSRLESSIPQLRLLSRTNSWLEEQERLHEEGNMAYAEYQWETAAYYAEDNESEAGSEEELDI